MSRLELSVDDLDVAAAFYTDVFGFEVVARRGPVVVLQPPGGTGSLALERAHPRRRVTHFALELLRPADVHLALDLVVAAGGRVLERSELATGSTTAVVADPTGNRITLH